MNCGVRAALGSHALVLGRRENARSGAWNPLPFTVTLAGAGVVRWSRELLRSELRSAAARWRPARRRGPRASASLRPRGVTALGIDPNPDANHIVFNKVTGNGAASDPGIAPLSGADLLWDGTGSGELLGKQHRRLDLPRPATGAADDGPSRPRHISGRAGTEAPRWPSRPMRRHSSARWSPNVAEFRWM